MDLIDLAQNVGRRWYSDDGKEISGCIFCAEFLHYESNCQLLKEFLFPRSNQSSIPINIQQEAMLYILFYLEIALHISGGNITHHQERKQL
jgi:hypothetical protein